MIPGKAEDSEPRLAGLILAAGESSRMGSDKALLDYGGSTFLETLINLFLRRVFPVVVVLGHNAAKIQAALAPRPGLIVAVNSNYKAGQLSSLQTGIRALPRGCEGALFTLVDHPAVADATIAAMIRRFAGSNLPLVVPCHQGRRGHPVLLSRLLLDEIAALPVSGSAKEVIRAHLDIGAVLDVDDPGILRDIDTPEDYRDLKASGSPGC
ncbi:MAG TPA: nucleotidyltransferase family protein [Bryobacterales bacterium]|nr:nucleotidyltransferase family protein [Bryobacterales bacterium]